MNVKELVGKYGGQSALAAQLGIRQSAIAYWVKKDAIPSKWHEQLLSIAQSSGIDILATDLLSVRVGVHEGAEVAGNSAQEAMTEPLAEYTPMATGAEQFLFYASEGGTIKVQVMLGEETVWATQQGIAEIFDTTKQNISSHLSNIYNELELDEGATVKEILTVQQEGERSVNRSLIYYNLDAIISIGYRVNSYKATQFRRWATSVLKEYMIKGFALDDDKLKQGKALFGKDYFDELLERIREIRASERRFYQRVTDIYRECSVDYDPESPITKEFYAHVQDKLHFAIHGHTSAELVKLRADASKPCMGLTSYKNEKTGGKVTKLDVTVGKNYLTEEEMDGMNRLVSMYLDWAENFAKRHIPMTMKDWSERLDGFLNFNAYQVLDGYGSVRRTDAQRHAELEYEKFRVIQDREFKSDFDKVVDEIRVKRRLPKPSASTK